MPNFSKKWGPALALTIAGALIGPPGYAQTVDGRRDAAYGPALALQNNTTGFGDNVSELDGVYARISGGKLYLLLTGNLDTGGNRLVLFLDDSPKVNGSTFNAGEWPSIGNSDRLDNLAFEPGFTPEIMLSLYTSGANTYADFAAIHAASSFFLGSADGASKTLTFPSGATGALAVDNANRAGVNATPSASLGNPGAVTTGIELAIPLTDIAPGYSAATPLRLVAFIASNSFDLLSNQVLGGIGGGSPAANVANIGEPNGKSLATGYAGAQLVTLQRGDVAVASGESVDLMGDFRFVTVEQDGALRPFGALDVSRSLRVLGGSLDLTSPGAVITGAGSFAFQGSGDFRLANPGGLTTSGTSGALQNTGTRTLSTSAKYSYELTSDGVTGNLLPGAVRELIVEKPGGGPVPTLTLTQPVFVTEAVRCLGANLQLNGNALRLISNATTHTALIENVGGAVLGTTGAMESALDPSFIGVGYRHYSSPTSGMTVGGLATFGFQPIVDPAFNSPTPPPYTPGTFPNVFYFDEALATNDFVAGYQSPVSLSAPMKVGQGFAVRAGGTPKMLFTGTFTTGDQSVMLTRTGNSLNNSGWNLVGNPFPSPLDWNAVTVPAGMSAQVSVQSPLSSLTADGGVYLTTVNGMGTLPLSWLPAAQGFFVLRTATGSGALTLPQSARVTTLDGPTTHYRSAPDPRPMVDLALEGTGTLVGMVDHAIVYFQDGATAAQDDRFDGLRVSPSTGDAPTLSTRLATGELAQVDGRPVLARDVEIPLDLQVNRAGTYTLTAAALRNFLGDQPVVLVDALTETEQDLRIAPTYTFSLPEGKTPARFSLRFGAGEAANAVASSLLSVFPNPSTGTVKIEWAGADPLHGSLTLTDLLGRAVRSQPADGIRLTLRDLPKGVYSLKVQSTEGPVARRIVVE